CYLDRDSLSDDERGLRYANMLADKIEELGPSTVLAFVVEPIGGASTGALVAPDSYLPRIREICDQYGILLIADEVMTGAGRTGQFLGCDHWQVVPDIAALAKGFGAGYVPLGAMLTRADIVDAVLDHNAFQHGFTSAGNPLACATGLAVVNEICEQDLISNTSTVGAALKSALTELMDEFPFIGDVRGKGLLLAMELVKDRETMQVLPPAMNAANRIVDIAYDRGLIVYARRTRGGNSGDHIMVCPPMISTLQHIDEILHKLRASLQQFSTELSLQ
ncbi:MAG: aminotransferase class III-fold pyridoxal phosphate-dependent enzyme, partial [Woeseia sp.]